MYYDRKVKYLDYCENGIRVKGCGVVKVQIRDKSLTMEIMVNGLFSVDSFQREVLICTESGGEEIGKISIENGKGSFRFQCDDMEQLHKSEHYRNWSGIRIILDESREIRGIWKDDREQGRVFAAERGTEPETTQAMRQTEREAIQDLEKSAERSVAQTSEQGAEQSVTQVMEQTAELETTLALRRETGRGTEWTTAQKADRVPERPTEQNAEEENLSSIEKVETRQSSKSRSEKQIARALAEDKWEQLWAIYPHINPFRDEREYLSISPADFVIFSAESYRVVNNSFLLHGFYNYHHLILAQMEKKGEKIYYVGVPGNFFEREKQVAIMFGFESFECEEEPAQAGDFGYYMMRAQL